MRVGHGGIFNFNTYEAEAGEFETSLVYKVSPCVKKGGGKISDPKKFEDIKPMLTHKNLQNILPSGFDTAKVTSER